MKSYQVKLFGYLHIIVFSIEHLYSYQDARNIIIHVIHDMVPKGTEN